MLDIEKSASINEISVSLNDESSPKDPDCSVGDQGHKSSKEKEEEEKGELSQLNDALTDEDKDLLPVNKIITEKMVKDGLPKDTDLRKTYTDPASKLIAENLDLYRSSLPSLSEYVTF